MRLPCKAHSDRLTEPNLTASAQGSTGFFSVAHVNSSTGAHIPNLAMVLADVKFQTSCSSLHHLDRRSSYLSANTSHPVASSHFSELSRQVVCNGLAACRRFACEGSVPVAGTHVSLTTILAIKTS